jgi:hypothetical protein
MKSQKNTSYLQVNIIGRDLVLLIAGAAAIALAFGTLVVLAVSRF